MAALDIKERQILVWYDAGPDITWHHRVLSVSLGDHDWIALTPDWAVQGPDVSVQPVVPLPRGRPIPAAQQYDCYIFDPPAPQELRGTHLEGGALVGVYASNPEVADEVDGCAAEPGHQRFGKGEPGEVRPDPERASELGTKGSAHLEGGVGNSDVFVQRVVQTPLSAWNRGRGEGGKSRPLGPFRTEAGRRRLPIREAVGAGMATKFEDFPFPDALVGLERPHGIIETTDSDLDSSHRIFLASSVLGTHSAIAHDHRVLLETLRLVRQYDQVNAPSLAAAEQITRRVVQHELAEEWDPQHPEGPELGPCPAGSVEEQGSEPVPMFWGTLAERQQQRAQIFKKARSFREEEVAERKRQKGDGLGGREKEQGSGGGGRASPSRV